MILNQTPEYFSSRVHVEGLGWGTMSVAGAARRARGRREESVE